MYSNITCKFIRSNKMLRLTKVTKSGPSETVYFTFPLVKKNKIA